MLSGGFGGGFSSGDFTVIGYSSDTAMTDFVSGNASMADGAMFDERYELTRIAGKPRKRRVVE